MYLVLLFAAWALRTLWRGELRAMRWPPWPAWGLVIVGALSLSRAASLKLGLAELAQMILYLFCAYMIFVNTFDSLGRIRTAIRLFLVVAGALALLALVQYVARGFRDPEAVTATFGTRNVYSALVIMALPLGLAYGYEQVRQREVQRAWMPILVTLVGVIVVLTCTAGGLFLIAVGTFLYVALRRAQSALSRQAFRGPEVLIWRTAILGCGLAAVLAVALPLPTRAGLADLFTWQETGLLDAGGGKQTAVRKRWLEWAAACNLLADEADEANFILGVGVGNYQPNIGAYYLSLPNLRKIEKDTSNLYLVTAASMGFAGLVCLVAYLLHFWRLARPLWDQGEDYLMRAVGLGLTGSVIGITAANLFTNVLVRGTGILFILLLALIAGLSEVVSRGRPQGAVHRSAGPAKGDTTAAAQETNQ